MLSLIACYALLAAGLMILFVSQDIESGITLYVVVIAISFLIALFNQKVVWPALVVPKKWETLEDALPKSRLVGYSLFLIAPLALIWLALSLLSG